MRVILFGTSGYALTHLRRARALHDVGEIVLAGACDVREPSAEARALLPAGSVFTSDATELLATRPEIAIVATPPHTHLSLGLLAAEAGCRLFLEKPPVLDLAAFDRLSEALVRSGLVCQVGFQSFGSSAIPLLRGITEDIGALTGVGAAGAWIRRDRYFQRSDWAGRRRVGGQAVVDGSLTNPFAHAVATALLLNGTAESLPGDVTVELYHARDIEADDTACARMTFPGAPDVVVATTLCAEKDNEPYVVLHGTRGEARWEYKTDRLEVNGVTVPVGPPVDLLGNLVSHLRDPGATTLLAPLSSTRAFTALVEAVRDAPDPLPVSSEWFTAVDQGPDRHFVVPGVDRAVDTAARRLTLFSEQDLPWAAAGPVRRAV